MTHRATSLLHTRSFFTQKIFPFEMEPVKTVILSYTSTTDRSFQMEPVKTVTHSHTPWPHRTQFDECSGAPSRLLLPINGGTRTAHGVRQSGYSEVRSMRCQKLGIWLKLRLSTVLLFALAALTAAAAAATAPEGFFVRPPFFPACVGSQSKKESESVKRWQSWQPRASPGKQAGRSAGILADSMDALGGSGRGAAVDAWSCRVIRAVLWTWSSGSQKTVVNLS